MPIATKYVLGFFVLLALEEALSAWFSFEPRFCLKIKQGDRGLYAQLLKPPLFKFNSTNPLPIAAIAIPPLVMAAVAEAFMRDSADFALWQRILTPVATLVISVLILLIDPAVTYLRQRYLEYLGPGRYSAALRDMLVIKDSRRIFINQLCFDGRHAPSSYLEAIEHWTQKIQATREELARTTQLYENTKAKIDTLSEEIVAFGNENRPVSEIELARVRFSELVRPFVAQIERELPEQIERLTADLEKQQRNLQACRETLCLIDRHLGTNYSSAEEAAPLSATLATAE